MADPAQIRAQLERYERFLAQDPRNAGLLTQVAELRMRTGDLTGARLALDEALSVSPGNSGVRSQQATLAIASGEPAKAVALLHAMIAEGIESPVLRYNLAYALMYTGAFAEAKEHLSAIIDSPEVPADAPLLLARALHHLGELDEAIAVAKGFIEKNPANIAGLGYLALLSLDSEDAIAAKEWAEKAVAGDPENLEGLVTLGSLALEEQDEPTATAYFERATAQHPKSGRAWGGLALSDMLKMQLEKAKEHLALAVKYMPNHTGTWHVVAWCDIVTGNLVGAREAFTKALELNRNFGETHGGLAVVAALEGRVKDAEHSMRLALRLDPGSFAGRFAQSLLLSRAGNTGAAQAQIHEILRSRLVPEGKSLEESLAKIFRTRDGSPRKH